ncbi:GNAT family N-acetyltransferase [Streptomyces poriferorum]|uniref:GNAT family N-acetyltransferase n=1 Tax=Streptomyces poriferorum TaxID=2798799 RepID=A0ABY9IK42_9ACTN|nr:MULTISPECIES: GNAT family N-acetyltransferase [unclassified Streptomyces]MDP5315555.1 GNAT family N-acetyltransferase [Streptomyces sp. Alt4]WLQ51652.1 GNAT family N-acetyltransferase [Streptomyces sp. Alt1]WLQ55596.1 GNAT family N-acetyltransferase [Streptomyces sp. Alt2]
MSAAPPPAAPARRTLMRWDLAAPPRPYPLPAPYRAAPVTPADATLLGELSYRAYRGGVDDEGESAQWHRGEMAAALAGEFGAVDQRATRVAWYGSTAASLSFVTLWKSRPLVAFALTDPEHTSRGLARALLTHSATVLRAAGASELTLVVTDGNPAVRLYTRLGFAPAG